MSKRDRLYDLFMHVIHLLPFNKVDFSRLFIHLFAMLLTALSVHFTANVSLASVLNGWVGAALLYSAGYFQRSIKEDETLGTKTYPEED